MNFWKILIVGLVFVIVSCNDDNDDDIKITPDHSSEVVDNTISTDFSTNSFSSETEKELLKEIKICDPKSNDDTDEVHASCSPKFFRFFKLSKKEALKDGFVLLVKAGVNGFPLRRTLVFQREKGVLVKVNGFNGNIIERRPNLKAGYDDLVMRFPDNYLGNIIYYNCLFTWQEGKYQYVNCEVIDENGPHKVLESKKDSMAIEIKKILDQNDMLF